MPRTVRFFLVLVALASGACTRPREAGGTRPPDAVETVGFVNRVWSVQQSNAAAPGTLYVFLSDGTLVITSSSSTPMVGTWKRTPEGLSMVEEGLAYRVEILGLTDRVFSIRSHNPGTPVDITLVPAEVPAA